MARSSLLLTLALCVPACATVSGPREAVVVRRQTTAANTDAAALAGDWLQGAPVRSTVGASIQRPT